MPAFQPQQRGVGAAHRAVGQAEAGGALEHLPAAAAPGEALQLVEQRAVAAAGLAAGWRHGDQATVGIQLQHRLAVFRAHPLELLGREAQIRRQPQRRQWRGCAGHGLRPADWIQRRGGGELGIDR